MTSGIIIENLTRDELLHQFTLLSQRITVLEEKISLENSRDVTLAELAKKTGWCKATIKRTIEKKNIPFSYEGNELMIKREHIGKFRVKQTA